jgi:hypothetical protein
MTVIHVLHEGGHWRAHIEIPNRLDASEIVSNWPELEDFASGHGITLGPGVLDVADTAAFTEAFGPAPANIRLH